MKISSIQLMAWFWDAWSCCKMTLIEKEWKGLELEVHDVKNANETKIRRFVFVWRKWKKQQMLVVTQKQPNEMAKSKMSHNDKEHQTSCVHLCLDSRNIRKNYYLFYIQ